MTAPLTAPSFPVSILIAGDPSDARRACREFCMAGLCVTVTPTEYVYKGGSEAGVIVGLINYPRFPKEPPELERTALELTEFLMDQLFQVSATIQTPLQTLWLSRRGAGGLSSVEVQ